MLDTLLFKLSIYEETVTRTEVQQLNNTASGRGILHSNHIPSGHFTQMGTEVLQEDKNSPISGPVQYPSKRHQKLVSTEQSGPIWSGSVWYFEHFHCNVTDWGLLQSDGQDWGLDGANIRGGERRCHNHSLQ